MQPEASEISFGGFGWLIILRCNSVMDIMQMSRDITLSAKKEVMYDFFFCGFIFAVYLPYVL